jgi:peptidoglycan/xylan/chitin deacetylase (PgdA/CDA1 family)
MPVLMYHSIQNLDGLNDFDKNLSVSPAKFESQLSRLIAAGYSPTTFIDVNNGNIPQKPIILSFDDGWENYYTNALPILVKYKAKSVVFLIAGKSGNGYLNDAEITQIIKSGMEIGDHTYTHPDLTVLNDKQLAYEIASSKQFLENKYNINIISLCYPSGSYNDRVIVSAKEAGYKFATTTKKGAAAFANPFSLSRYRVFDSTNVVDLING